MTTPTMQHPWYQRALRDFVHSDKWIRGVYEGQGALIGKKKRSWRISNDDDGVIRYILYNTAVLSYSPDGSVVLNTDGWDTGITNGFIWDYLTREVYYNRGRLGDMTQTYVTNNSTGELSGFDTRMRLVPYGDTLRVESPLPTKKRVINKEKTKEAMDADEAMVGFMAGFNMLAMVVRGQLAENEPPYHNCRPTDVFNYVAMCDLKEACNRALWGQLYNDYPWPDKVTGAEPVDVAKARSKVYAAWKRGHARYNIVDVPPVPPRLGV